MPINHLYYNPKRIQYIPQDIFIQALSRSLQFLYLLVAAGVRLNLSPEIGGQSTYLSIYTNLYGSLWFRGLFDLAPKIIKIHR